MSAGHEAHHGHGEETSITSIIVSIVMALFGVPELLGEGEKVVQSVVAPDAAGHSQH